MGLLTWEVPEEINIGEVKGADVRSWSRTGKVVQVWLHRSLAETAAELVGWVSRDDAKASSTFRLPYVRCATLQPRQASFGSAPIPG